MTFLSYVLSERDFVSWGWRLAFMLSIALLAVGLFIRLRVLETLEFAKVRAHEEVSRSTGPQAAMFCDLFDTRVRYTGVSLIYQIGAIFSQSRSHRSWPPRCSRRTTINLGSSPPMYPPPGSLARFAQRR